MTNAIDGPGQPGPNPTVIPPGNPAASGSFHGERVVHMPNPTAQLQDAAEELAFTRSESAQKRLSQRKLSSTRALRNLALEQARKYLEEVPDLERSQKLSDFAKSVLQSDRPPNPESLRLGAEEFSDDVTHQFLALSFAHELGVRQNAGPEFIAALEEAIDGLREDSGPAIQAGLNISSVAHRFSSEELGTTQELRDLYRDVVLDCEDIHEAHQRIVEGHPDKTFDEAIRFLLNALGTDLAASSRTVSKGRLKQIMDDMYQLKSLNSIHRECEDLMRRAHAGYGAEPGPEAVRSLMSELLTAQTRAWQGADAFKSLPEKLGVNGDEGSIYLLHGFKELIRSLPLKAFGDDQTQRDRVMISVQQALDLAIDNEGLDD